MVETSGPVTREEIRKLLREHYAPDEQGLLLRQLQRLQRERWVSWGLMALGVVVIAVLSLRPALIPYPIVYDPDGRLIWHGTAETTREERFIDVGLMDCLRLMRAVSSDETVFRESREQAASMMSGKAAEQFAAYNKASVAAYKDHARRVFVQVDRQLMTVTREGPQQVRITWPETWTPEFGYGSETRRFQALLTYTWQAQPQGFTQAQARLNPRRLYVTEYTWDEIRAEGR